MKTGFKNLIYIGKDQKFILNLNQVYQNKSVNLIILNDGSDLKKIVMEISTTFQNQSSW